MRLLPLLAKTAIAAVLLVAAPTLALRSANSEDGQVHRGERLTEYDAPREIARLENKNISESSGLAPSRRRPDVFWTHNDSGDSPRVFAFDLRGRHLGECQVLDAGAVDWEDMASFNRGGNNYLLLADVGDNRTRRSHCTLYLVEEPNVRDKTVRPSLTVHFRYDDGPANCEAVAVDPTSATVLLVSKSLAACRVYQLDLPAQAANETLTARRIARLSVPLATAMDVSPDGRRAIVLSYGPAYEYARLGDETWAQTLSRPPRTIAMPPRRQGESICYGADGRTLYLTSEKTPTPLWEVPLLNIPQRGGEPSR